MQIMLEVTHRWAVVGNWNTDKLYAVLAPSRSVNASAHVTSMHATGCVCVCVEGGVCYLAKLQIDKQKAIWSIKAHQYHC